MEIVGWLGGIFFAVCGIPQAHKCWKQKHAHGVSYLLLFFWFFGELLTMFYVGANDKLSPSEKAPLLLNYGFNLMTVLIVAYYRFFPKDEV